MSSRWILIPAAVAILGIRLGERSNPLGRDHAREILALKSIQILNTAQVQYNSQFGRYARSLSELGPRAADLISPDLASGERQGYKFIVSGTPAGYTISAVPAVFGSTGSRTFYSDQSLVIRENYGPEPATAISKEVGSAAAKAGDSKWPWRRGARWSA